MNQYWCESNDGCVGSPWFVKKPIGSVCLIMEAVVMGVIANLSLPTCGTTADRRRTSFFASCVDSHCGFRQMGIVLASGVHVGQCNA